MPKPQEAPKLALNVFDLGKLPAPSRSILAGKLGREPIRMSKRGDDVALALTCPLLEAALTVDLCRSEARMAGLNLRAYRNEGGWEPLPAAAVLTLAGPNGVELSGIWLEGKSVKMGPSSKMFGEEG